jgi:RHS repeat-associated protein
MRQSKPVSLLNTFLSVFFSVFMAIPNMVWAQAFTEIRIVPTPPPTPPATAPLGFKLEVRSTTNGVACLVQTGISLTSTNPADWRTLLSVQASPTNTVVVPGFQATNRAAFYRALEFLAASDTNAPAWSNAVGGGFSFFQSSNLLAQWSAAADNFAVSAYRIYLGTNLFTNVLGNTLSALLPIHSRQRADIRIQAVDASGNASAILSLLYLPGDKMLSACVDDGRVYVLHVREDGTFTPARQIANFGAFTRGLALGDFDKDGIQDLIAGHGGNGAITLFFYKGLGDGNFGPAQPLPTAQGSGNWMMDGTAGDFDCDGNLDFVCSGDSRYIFFYWGNGDGTFKADVRDWGDAGRGMDAGDLNEDGRVDLVRGVYSDGNIRVYLSNGDRTFTETNRIQQSASDRYGVVVGDFDEDGHLDLLANSAGSGDITFFKGLGDGSFTNRGVNGVRANLDVNNYASMDAYDYNEDGHLDLVMVTYNTQTVYFWAGNGDGTFSDNRLTLADGIGNALGVSTPPLPPRVDVAIAPGRPTTNLNQPLRLEAVGSGVTSNDFFRWSFGDLVSNTLAWTITPDMTNMGRVVSHAYTNEGNYVARVVHDDTNGNRSARGTWVTILGEPPVARPGGPYALGEESASQSLWSATVDGSASTDDFGIINYAWTFGDGSATNNGPTVRHTWPTAGLWKLGLTVTDIVGQTSSNSTTVSFTPGAPPVAAISGPALLDETAASTGLWRGMFSGANSTDDHGIWKYDWNFGNGTIGTGVSAQGSFTAPTNYTVTLTVTDHAGQTGSVSHQVAVQAGTPPVAVITGPSIVDETSASNGVWRATFSGAGSTDDRGIWKYDWDFGNGTTGTGVSAQGSFIAPTNYTVTLTVTDHAGQTATTNWSVQVKANGLPTPVITGPRLITEATATNRQWFGTWNGLASTDDRGIYRYDWNFGDGTTGTGAAITHAYTNTGLYQLVLTVMDFGNQTQSTTQNVAVIAGTPPQPQISATNTHPEGAQPIFVSGRASTDDHGIASVRWILPPRLYTFDGQYLDAAQWTAANTRQDDKLIVTGNGNWGQSYFFNSAIRLQGGATTQGRVDTSSGTSRAMVGFKNLNFGSGQYDQLAYALDFRDGGVYVYESGADRGWKTDYSKGSSYDFHIEAKLTGGARYFLRPADQGVAFTLIAETDIGLAPNFSVGVDVLSGVFAFDDLTVDGLDISTWDFTTGFTPGGAVTLEVVDHAGQTNTTSVAINPIVGAPPVAVIVGPTNAPAGVELAYHGYLSTDDYGIASYSWDFGDGSPLAFGPTVAHAYNTPGIYTNTLTVRDYAGQYGVAAALVLVGPGNQLVCIPWRILGGVEYPHETYSGKAITLKAVAKGVPLPFDYIWDFGDGSPLVTNTVSTPAGAYGLEAVHVYSADEGTPFEAKIRIAGTALLDTYPVIVRNRTLETERHVAIDEGLWYLHKVQTRVTIDAQNEGGSWSCATWGNYYNNITASAVQAFAVNGHYYTGDVSQDPYAETVQRGLNFLLDKLAPIQIGERGLGNPDGNGNGLGVSCTISGDSNYDRVVYELGVVMDALVAAARPDFLAPVGRSGIKGRALRDLMQDMVDVYSWSQNSSGGWRYKWTASDSDNSACQWAAIGFLAAERGWGVPVQAWVKQRNMNWVVTSLGNNGYFGYQTGWCPWGECSGTTASAMIQLTANGIYSTNVLWRQGLDYLANNWTAIMSAGNVYTDFAIAKALRTALPYPVETLTLTTNNWFLDPTNGLARVTINRQASNGAWFCNYNGYLQDTNLSTAWSVLILSSSILQAGPVAKIQVRPNPTAVGFPVVFDGRASFHQEAAGRVVEYRWDFDSSNGLDFDHPDAYGPIVTNRFGFMGTNTVHLQVRDNSTPQLNDVASVQVFTTIPPYPPTADAGGPYVVCVGQQVNLDGSGSFDVDGAQGDYIQTWDWEIDNAMPRDFDDGVTGVRATITNGYATAGQYTVGLRVRDATSIVFTNLNKPDLTGVDFATVYVYNRVITNLVGRAKDNKIQLVWNPVGDYSVITRSTAGPDRGFVEIGRTTNRFATFLDTDVDYNVPYFYRIYAWQNGQAAPLGISDPVNVTSSPRSFESCGPYFTATPPHEAVIGKLYEVQLQAKERLNNSFSYVMLAGPANMTLNTSNGWVHFQPAANQLGEHLVSFAVTNDCGTNVLSYTLSVFNVTNLPPIANIHGPYTGIAGQPIQFSSVGTFDPDTNDLIFVWAFGDGTIATNANPTHAFPAQGTYTVSLHVNDGHGGTATAFTQATIARANRVPIADAGPNLMPLVGQAVMLDGHKSWDADLDPLTYRWEVVLRPPGSTSTLTNATTARPSLLIDRPGFYTVQLIVNDGKADSTPDGVTLITANSPPIASAGRDQRVPEGNTAQLDGTASYDVDLQPLTYRWTLVSKPEGSTATLTNANASRPTFGVDLYGLYRAELVVNDGLANSAADQVIVTTGNLLPEIVSRPATTNAVFTYAWNYAVQAYDLDGTNLTFTLVEKPAGMTLTPQPPVLEPGQTNSAVIAWTPTRAEEGPHPVRIRVTDADGASVEQAFTVVASRDIDPPLVNITLVQGEVNPNNGQWSALLNSTARFRVTATDNVGVTALTLRVGSQVIPLDANGYGSYAATNVGIKSVVATASDAEGNVGSRNQTLYVRDPNAVSAVAVTIHSPTNTAIVTAPVGVYASITSAIPISVCTLEYARLASGSIDDTVGINDPSLQYRPITNLTVPPGTLVMSNVNIGRFDPTMLANDAYIIRLTALDMNLNGVMEGALVYVSGNLKFGEFHLDFTDLSIPVAGIPITITRSYDTRESDRQGDFGQGWTLGLADGHIVKSAMKWGFGMTGDERTITTRTRVYITKPDGRRVGFTVKPQIPPGDWFMGYPPGYSLLFGQLYEPGFEADPGVYDKLEAVGAPALFIRGDGAMVYPLFTFLGYDPDTFRLTTKDGTVYQYSQSEGLQTVTDLNTNKLVFTRDGIYHFSAGSTNYDQAVPFIRDAQGRITEIVDPTGKRLTYAYDSRGDLRSFTDQVTNVTQYLYSTARAHYLTNIIDPLGRSALRIEYDDTGRLVGIRDASGNLVRQDFPDAATAVFTDANGHTNIVRYDDNGNETMKAVPGISTNYFAYDANNNLLASTNGRGFSTNYTYDARGNVTSIRDPLGNLTTVAYNEQNKPVSVTNALGQVLGLRYDGAGKLLEVVNNAGLKTIVTRDSQGRVATLTDAANHTTLFDYTGGCACGKPGKVINPDGSFKLTDYDALGNTTRTVNELGAETFSFYDAGRKLLWTRDPLSNYTRFYYRGPLLTNVVDALGRSTRYEYDAQNRTNRIIDAEGGVVEFRFDGNGNRTHVIDATTNVTTFVYDAGNRLIQQIDPLGHTNFFGYDAAGNRTEAIDRNGRKRTFLYDAGNRMTNELWWEGTNVVRSIVFGFNEVGVQTLAEDPAARYEYHYDALNRLENVLAKSAGVPDFTLLYTYTALGQAESVTDNWGVRVGSTYDNRNRLAKRDWQGPGVDPARVDFAHDASGNRVRTDRFADLAGVNRIGRTTNAYNLAGIVTNITHLGPAAEVLAKYDYAFDAANQIRQWSINHQLSTFGYDGTGQLTNALNTAQPNENFRFDANGNRVGAQSGGSYVVGRNNQILGDGTNRYAYDAEGNLTSRSNTLTGLVSSYYWDHRNRLVSVLDRNPGGVVMQTVTFVYDAMNRRLSKTVNGQVTRFLYNGDDSWADLDGSSTVTARYLHGARIDELLACQRVSDGRGWYLTDHLGTVRDIANAAGVAVAHVDYSSFGQVLGVSNPAAVDRFLFTGRELDEETGLYFYRARYYSAQIARFVSNDPIGFDAGDANIYRYVRNSPLTTTDPTGQFLNEAMQFIIFIATLQSLYQIVRAPECSNLNDFEEAVVGGLTGFLGGIFTGIGLLLTIDSGGLGAGAQAALGLTGFLLPSELQNLVCENGPD